MGSGVGMTIGVDVAAEVGVVLGVTVQPGGRVGKLGKMEQPAIETTSQSPKRNLRCFNPFLYWQNPKASSGG